MKRVIPVVITVSLLAAACGNNTVVTQELGPRSDGGANPATPSTTMAPPPASADDMSTEELMATSINGFLTAINTGDVAGAHAFIAPQLTDECTLEEAVAIGIEPTGIDESVDVLSYAEIEGGAYAVIQERNTGIETRDVGMVLLAGTWYLDLPLCDLLQFQQVADPDASSGESS